VNTGSIGDYAGVDRHRRPKRPGRHLGDYRNAQ